MAKYLFVVMTNAVIGEDAVFNDWYDNVHVADVLKIPGFQAVQRFRLPEAEAGSDVAKWRYLSLYEVEAERPEIARAALAAAGKEGDLPVSPALAPGVFALFFEPIGPRVVA